ncbi:Peptidase, partial [Globisporangium splendens]
MLWTRSLLVASALVATAAHAAEDRCTAILVGAKMCLWFMGRPDAIGVDDRRANDDAHERLLVVRLPHRQGAGAAARTRCAPRRRACELLLPALRARGKEYLPENLDARFPNRTATPVIGTIPEVNETFAYIDGAYGIINEHQVAIGESTCGARFVSKPITQGGAALFDVAALSRIALQRAKTARAAIRIMGDLAVQYGYYGAEWEGDEVYAEAGEALTVTDATEAWMFHILPDDTGKSAIWAAQRVPDDHMSAVANQFVIHEMDLNNTDAFLASDNIYDVALRNGIWNHSESFDFTRIYSQPRAEGHQYYSTRRVWRLFTLADPSLNLSAETDVFSSDYPFSVKPAQTLSPQDIMRFQRDHYEGTAFDMTKGPAGGPYGDPDRYDGGVNGNMTMDDVTSGSFERAISIFRASYSFVSILDPANADNAYIWFGQYAPHATSYAPVYTKVSSVPSQYTRGSLHAFDRESSFWVHAIVGNWVARVYKYAHPFVQKVQLELEDLVNSLQSDLLSEAARVKQREGDAAMIAFLTEQSALFASQSHRTFSELFEYLITVFHDGYQMSNMFSATHLTATPLFYPKWWLQQVGYYGSNQTEETSKESGDDTVVVPSVVGLPSIAPATVEVTDKPTVAPATTQPPVTFVPLSTQSPATSLPPVTFLPQTPRPVVGTSAPSPTPSAETVRVRSTGDDATTTASPSHHQVSYWMAALIAVVSLGLGVVIGRCSNRFKKSGYRPIR